MGVFSIGLQKEGFPCFVIRNYGTSSLLYIWMKESSVMEFAMNLQLVIDKLLLGRWCDGFLLSFFGLWI